MVAQPSGPGGRARAPAASAALLAAASMALPAASRGRALGWKSARGGSATKASTFSPRLLVTAMCLRLTLHRGPRYEATG